MAVGVRTRNRRFGVPREELLWIRDTVARMTAAADGGCLRLDVTRLSDDERERLLELSKKAEEGGGFLLDRLGARDRKRWEQLVERGSNRVGFFQQERDRSELQAGMAEVGRKLRLPPKRVRYEAQGSVRIPRRLFQHFDRNGKNPKVQIPTAGILMLVVTSLENGAALAPNSRIDGSGDDAVLVLDRRMGVGQRFDPPGDWLRRIDHLGKVGWLAVEHRGQEIRIGRGPLMLKTIRGAL